MNEFNLNFMQMGALLLAYISGIGGTLTTLAFSTKQVGVGILGAFATTASFGVAMVVLHSSIETEKILRKSDISRKGDKDVKE